MKLICINKTLFIIIHIGFKYQNPPPLPCYHTVRQSLLDEIVTKVRNTTKPEGYGITLTITGAGGFGKTSTVISLCHNSVMKEHFTDGFVFIELGQKSVDPIVKLKGIYNMLTDQQCDINVVEQKINQLTGDYFRNLLVIIDDVWHVEDAEPLVKAFSNCKTILTTRMNDIEQYIPSKQSVIVGPMTPIEARLLLTSGLVDSSNLSQEDVSLLDELAEDVHLWPLLLSLMRGQLSLKLKHYHLSYHTIIQNVQADLHRKGLTAFDKNNINDKEAIHRSRNFAVKACIEISLELLTKSLSNKLKTLILYTGIDTSLQKAVLRNLWNTSNEVAEDTVSKLWTYGLVQFTDKITDIVVSPYNITQRCVQVHAVISHYITECMDSNEFYTLSPYGGISYTAQSVLDGLQQMYQQAYGLGEATNDLALISSVDLLKYKLSEIESTIIPCFLQSINMYIVTDPHIIIKTLEQTKDKLMTFRNLSSSCEEINLLISECKEFLKNAYQVCKKLNQRVQKSMHEKSYDKLVQHLEEWIKSYSLFDIARKVNDFMNKITSYCSDNQELVCYIRNTHQYLVVYLRDYHQLNTFAMPKIKFCINLCKRINRSLLNGSPNVELTYYYFWSQKCNEDLQVLEDNHLIKLEEVAPNIVQLRRAQKQSL